MASIKKHKRSPFWILRYRDEATGTWKDKSTGCRHDRPVETRKAQRMADDASVREKRMADASGRDVPAFRVWVPGYIESHYMHLAAGTKARYVIAWQRVRSFLVEHDIVHPAQVRYRHGAAYMDWRKNLPDTEAVGHNTALAELKFLVQLMNEAVRREFIPGNPLAKLGIKKAPQAEKPELTDDDIAKIRAYLARPATPAWKRIAFEIALYTGCRFQECEIPMERIDFERDSIMLRDAKRDEADPRKFFTVPLHPDLRPTLLALRNAGEKITCLLSPRDRNRRMNEAFRMAGVDATFHSLRVTFITRCQRGIAEGKGLSQAQTMRLVNHSTTTVHRIYSRMNVEDARAAQAQIPLPRI